MNSKNKKQREKNKFYNWLMVSIFSGFYLLLAFAWAIYSIAWYVHCNGHLSIDRVTGTYKLVDAVDTTSINVWETYRYVVDYINSKPLILNIGFLILILSILALFAVISPMETVDEFKRETKVFIIAGSICIFMKPLYEGIGWVLKNIESIFIKIFDFRPINFIPWVVGTVIIIVIIAIPIYVNYLKTNEVLKR